MLKSILLPGSTREDCFLLVRYAMQSATNLTTCWRNPLPPFSG